MLVGETALPAVDSRGDPTTPPFAVVPVAGVEQPDIIGCDQAAENQICDS